MLPPLRAVILRKSPGRPTKDLRLLSGFHAIECSPIIGRLNPIPIPGCDPPCCWRFIVSNNNRRSFGFASG